MEFRQGDILGVELTTFYSQITKKVQQIAGFGDLAKVTHTAVVRIIDNIVFVQEMDGKHNVLRPIEQYHDEKVIYRVYRTNLEFSNELLNGFLLKPIKYKITDLIKIGFHILFKFNRNGQANFDGQVCSEYDAAILRKAGFTGHIYNMPSPSEVCFPLKTPIFVKSYE